MTDRSSISVFLNGRMVFAHLYENASFEELFHEAIAVSALSADPGYQEAFLSRDDDEWNAEMMRISEFPVAIDLDAGFIYSSYYQLTADEIASLDEVEYPVRDYGAVLANCRIPCIYEDPYAILELYENSPLFDSLSSLTADLLHFLLLKRRPDSMFS